MRNRLVFLIFLSIATGWLSIVRTAQGDAYTYTTVRKQIRVGVLQIGT
jgi:hypothetical protein